MNLLSPVLKMIMQLIQHNIHGISSLVESFDSFKGSKCIIFSALKRKQYQEMIDILSKHCDELIITSFENDNAIDTA